MKSFSNKVAAITGAASGIGRALALDLAERGCQLALADVNAAGLESTRQAAAKSGVKVTVADVDVGDPEAVTRWADAVVRGHGRVNLIFNNAGVGQVGPVETNAIEDYEWIFRINFWGVVYGTKAFLPHLKAAGEGHVVNISSVLGLFSQPGMSAYNATKFAVRGFTESLRQELDMMQCGVSATCVHPGGIKTAIARTSRQSERPLLSLGIATTADEFTANFDHNLAKTTADKAARVILKGVQRDARRVLIGVDAHIIDLIQRVFPTGYQRYVVAAMLKRNKARMDGSAAADVGEASGVKRG